MQREKYSHRERNSIHRAAEDMETGQESPRKETQKRKIPAPSADLHKSAYPLIPTKPKIAFPAILNQKSRLQTAINEDRDDDNNNGGAAAEAALAAAVADPAAQEAKMKGERILKMLQNLKRKINLPEPRADGNVITHAKLEDYFKRNPQNSIFYDMQLTAKPAPQARAEPQVDIPIPQLTSADAMEVVGAEDAIPIHDNHNGGDSNSAFGHAVGEILISSPILNNQQIPRRAAAAPEGIDLFNIDDDGEQIEQFTMQILQKQADLLQQDEDERNSHLRQMEQQQSLQRRQEQQEIQARQLLRTFQANAAAAVRNDAININNNNNNNHNNNNNSYSSLDEDSQLFQSFVDKCHRAMETRYLPLPANCFAHCSHGASDLRVAPATGSATNIFPPINLNRKPQAEDAETSQNARPKGSMKREFPPPYLNCPCGCTSRTSLTAGELRIGVIKLIESGLLIDGDYITLHLPCADSNSSTPLAVIGQLQMQPATELFPQRIEYFDIGTARSYCCPAAWFISTYAVLSVQGRIPNSVDMAEKVIDQVKLDRNCMQFVSCLRLNSVLFVDLFVVYRHAIAAHHAAAASRHSIPEDNQQPQIPVALTAVPPGGKKKTTTTTTTSNRPQMQPGPNYQSTQGVQFPTQEQIIAQFAQCKTKSAWPVDQLWFQAMTSRLQQKDALIAALKTALVGGQAPPHPPNHV